MENNSFEVEGLKEAIDAISYLDPKRQTQIIEAFLLKTGKKFVSDELKSTLNYSSETEKSIKAAKVKKTKMAVKAGIQPGAYKIRWVDLGTKERKTKKGYNRGKISGREQVSPTIDKQIQPIIDYAENELLNELNNTIEKKLKKINNK